MVGSAFAVFGTFASLQLFNINLSDFAMSGRTPRRVGRDSADDMYSSSSAQRRQSRARELKLRRLTQAYLTSRRPSVQQRASVQLDAIYEKGEVEFSLRCECVNVASYIRFDFVQLSGFCCGTRATLPACSLDIRSTRRSDMSATASTAPWPAGQLLSLISMSSYQYVSGDVLFILIC